LLNGSFISGASGFWNRSVVNKAIDVCED
jgi:hypothetical protein